MQGKKTSDYYKATTMPLQGCTAAELAGLASALSGMKATPTEDLQEAFAQVRRVNVLRRVVFSVF